MTARDPMRDRFVRTIQRNAVVCAILERLPRLALPDVWLTGGCLFQTVWNVLRGNTPARGINDYDVFYFDAGDCSKAAEQGLNREAALAFSGLGCDLELRNQARVHIWYEDEFGVPGYPKLRRSTDGIDRFLAVCCMVAVRRMGDGEIELYAPFGVDDVFSVTMRPNPWLPNAPRDCYETKARKWQAQWPELRVLPLANGLSVGGGSATSRSA